MAQEVSRHSVKVLMSPEQQPAQPQPGCNCRNGVKTYPVQAGVVYKGTVTETVSGKKETSTLASLQTISSRGGVNTRTA